MSCKANKSVQNLQDPKFGDPFHQPGPGSWMSNPQQAQHHQPGPGSIQGYQGTGARAPWTNPTAYLGLNQTWGVQKPFQL